MGVSRILPRLAAGTALATAFAASAHAASLGSGAILRQLAPPPPAPSVPGEVIRLPPARGQTLKSNVRIAVQRVEISGNHLLPHAMLSALFRPVEGKTVSLARLQSYVARVSEAYHEHGYPLAFAYLPPQTIRNGVIAVKVVEPHYDRVDVTGKSRFREDQARRVMGVRAGDPVETSSLNRGLLLLDRTPGVRVKGALMPGAEPGTTTLRLIRTDRPIVGFSLSQNNYGNRYTGAEMTNATVSAYDPFGYGSSFSVNGAISGSGDLKTGGFAMISPDLSDGLRIGAYGSATSYRLGGAFAPLREVGRAQEIGGDLTYPVLLAPGRQVDVRADLLEMALAQSTRSTGTSARQSIPMERLSVLGQFADQWHGVTAANVALTHGDLSNAPAEAQATDAAGPRAAGGFDLMQIRVDRVQSLPLGVSLSLDAQGQVSDKNLDSSQQFFLGGAYGVVAYPVGAGGGDEGYLLSGRLSHAVPIAPLPGSLSASILADSGTVWLHPSGYAGFTGKNQESESGIGVGLNYNAQHVGVDLSYEHEIGANSATTVSRSRDQLLFQVTIRG